MSWLQKKKYQKRKVKLRHKVSKTFTKIYITVHSLSQWVTKLFIGNSWKSLQSCVDKKSQLGTDCIFLININYITVFIYIHSHSMQDDRGEHIWRVKTLPRLHYKWGDHLNNYNSTRLVCRGSAAMRRIMVFKLRQF